jgi:formylglycine-generating enzyme required for sulfatase activity
MSRLLSISLACLAVLGLAPAAMTAPNVTNVTASQRTDGTGLVDVFYDLSGASSPTMVHVTFSNDNGANWNILPTPGLLSGAVGPGITNGTGKHIVWDVARDRANVYWPNARARVTASEIDGNTITFQLPGSVPLEMVTIPAGSFSMGTGYDPPYHTSGAESPVHTVNIGYEFLMGKYEITQAQWFALMGGFPQGQPIADPNRPVVYISWSDITDFLTQLNNQGIGTFRLPSESEWEYACRAGTNTRWQHGNEEAGLENYAWYSANNTPSGIKAVGQKLPNSFGLYDMHGNVWEWVQDWYHSNYTGAPNNGSAWEEPVGSSRVLRGGGYYNLVADCRSAYRAFGTPSYRDNHLGFRIVRTN